MRIAHVAFDFYARRESSNRVDNDDVNRTRAHECFNNLKRLLTELRLREKQVVKINAKTLRILDVECVLGIDECCKATGLLCFCDHLQTDGCFT